MENENKKLKTKAESRDKLEMTVMKSNSRIIELERQIDIAKQLIAKVFNINISETESMLKTFEVHEHLDVELKNKLMRELDSVRELDSNNFFTLAKNTPPNSENPLPTFNINTQPRSEGIQSLDKHEYLIKKLQQKNDDLEEEIQMLSEKLIALQYQSSNPDINMFDKLLEKNREIENLTALNSKLNTQIEELNRRLKASTSPTPNSRTPQTTGGLDKAEQFDRLKAISDGLAQENKAAFAKLKLAEKEIESLRGQVEKLKGILTVHDTDCQQNSSLLIRTQKELEELKATSQALTAKLKQADFKLETLQRTRDKSRDIDFEKKEKKYRDEITQLSMLVDSLEATNQRNQVIIDQLSSKNGLEGHSGKKQSDSNQLQKVQAELDMASRLLESKEQELESANQLLNKQALHMRELKHRITQLETEAVLNQSEKNHPVISETNKEASQERIDELRKKLDTKENELKTVKNERKIFYDSLEQARAENDSLVHTIKEAEGELEHLRQKVNHLQSKVTDLEKERATLKSQVLSKLNESQSTRQESSEESSFKLSLLKSELEKARKEIDVMKRQQVSSQGSDMKNYKEIRFQEKSKIHIIEILNEKSREFETVYSTSFSDLRDNSPAYLAKVNKKSSFFETIWQDTRLSDENRFSLLCGNLNALLVHEDGLARLSRKLNDGLSDNGQVDFLVEVLDEFLGFYTHLKQRIGFLGSIVLASFSQIQKKFDPKKQKKASPFKLDLKEMYLTDIFFDEENQEYLKNCIIHYSQMKCAQRKIEHFMKQALQKKRRQEQGGFDNMDFAKFKAVTGKSLLKELLMKAEGYLDAIGNRMRQPQIGHW